MREIKFRYWYRNQNEMAYNIKMIFPMNSDHPVVMQYTGLKDKNGKEIYEGDILGYPNPLVKDVVKFGLYDNKMSYDCHVEGNGFYLERIGEGKVIQEFLVSGHTEIIGNIYENPELLEKAG